MIICNNRFIYLPINVQKYNEYLRYMMHTLLLIIHLSFQSFSYVVAPSTDCYIDEFGLLDMVRSCIVKICFMNRQNCKVQISNIKCLQIGGVSSSMDPAICTNLCLDNGGSIYKVAVITSSSKGDYFTCLCAKDKGKNNERCVVCSRHPK